jgi:hypothetical protein
MRAILQRTIQSVVDTPQGGPGMDNQNRPEAYAAAKPAPQRPAAVRSSLVVEVARGEMTV